MLPRHRVTISSTFKHFSDLENTTQQYNVMLSPPIDALYLKTPTATDASLSQRMNNVLYANYLFLSQHVLINILSVKRC